MSTRRTFLQQTALLPLLPGWLARAAETPNGKKKVLVVVFQRGAVDGLNMIVPFADPNYYDLRPTIAVPAPSAGNRETAIDLDGRFALHPSMASLKPMFDSGSLAIVHAAGSPDTTRSHFDAQDYAESGTPGRKSTSDGWLNRALAADSAVAKSPVRAVSLGPQLAKTLRGPNEAVAINNLAEFKIRDEGSGTSFESMYAATLDRVLKGSARDTFDAVKAVDALQKQSYAPANGARYPLGRLGQSLRQIAQIIKANAGMEVAFADTTGWDTHVNETGQTAATGQLANLLGNFAQSLAAFYTDMGDRMADVAVVTMSEFGRTARENGNRGTDHGHGNCMMVFGGSIHGGKVYGDWPGLAPEQLYEGRDLAVTTDFRCVLGELVARHLNNRNLPSVFPDFSMPAFRDIVRG